ncbi:MAG: PQQ-binding-like beta-propeller repeat protein [Planctomycetota bacterium]|nr:PQQ-binding-like beta-propeller repeat protein [Planctomycetota bacterium]MDA1213553.1 PQQ-binding-like beta-propeller repeat protein [Planctomycetota bacterium]
MASLFVSVVVADDKSEEEFPLHREQAVLERDLNSEDYQRVLETMIPTDLAAEWQRVAAPDNFLAFARKHGGIDKIDADPMLKAAYKRRRDVAHNFLELMLSEYAKRNVKPPFDLENLDKVLEPLLESSAVATDTLPETSVRVLLPAPGSETQWPRFRGPSGQGTVYAENVPQKWSVTENIAWKIELPGRGNSSPIVWDDKIFVTAEMNDRQDRALLCYSRTDGQLLWEAVAPRPEMTEPLYWKNTYATSTPVTDGEHVYALFGNAGLICCDFDGNTVWQKNLGLFQMAHGPGTSPVLYRDLVIVMQDQNQQDSLMVACDKKNGEIVWQQQRPRSVCWSTPVVVRVDDHDELIYNGSNTVIGYDPATGVEIWRVNGSSVEAVPTPVIGNGLIFSASGRVGPLLAIRPGGTGDISKTHLFWNKQRIAAHVPSPAFANGMLFQANDMGILTCFEAATGETLWQTRLRGKFSMSPLVIGDSILITSEEGLTTIFRAGDQFEAIAENDLAETIFATPAVLDGQIIFRTDSHLISIGK